MLIASEGNVWAADTSDFRPANTPASMAWETSEPISNTRDDALYQTERFGRGGDLMYSIPVPQTGDYLVRLHFSENFKGNQAPDQRKFHVAIEGKLEIANVDIFSESNNEGYHAMSRAVQTVVTGETLDIEFVKVE